MYVNSPVGFSEGCWIHLRIKLRFSAFYFRWVNNIYIYILWDREKCNQCRWKDFHYQMFSAESSSNESASFALRLVVQQHISYWRDTLPFLRGSMLSTTRGLYSLGWWQTSHRWLRPKSAFNQPLPSVPRLEAKVVWLERSQKNTFAHFTTRKASKAVVWRLKELESF